MAFRNPKPLLINRFRGHNTYANKENIAPDWWTDSMNVTVNASGTAEVLRSPRGINVATTTGNPILRMMDYFSTATHKLLFDIKDGSAMKTYTINDNLTNNLVRSGQTVFPFVSLVVNGLLYRVNQHEMIQYMTDASTSYRVGIDAPAAAPTISYVAGGSGAIASGIQAS